MATRRAYIEGLVLRGLPPTQRGTQRVLLQSTPSVALVTRRDPKTCTSPNPLLEPGRAPPVPTPGSSAGDRYDGQENRRANVGMWVGLGGWEDRQDHDARRTRNGRVVTIPSAGSEKPPTYPHTHPLPWPASRHPWRRCPRRRGGPRALRSWWGLPPILGGPARMEGEGEKKEKEGEEDRGRTVFCFCPFPIRHPGCPGPWWIRAGNVCADSVPPRWFTQKGRGPHMGPRAHQSAGTGRSLGVWEGMFLIGLPVMLFL